MKRKIVISIILLFSLFILLWGSSLIYCETLTHKHGNKFSSLYHQTNVLNNIDYLKVICYQNKFAKIYYVSEGESGSIIEFEQKESGWEILGWKTVWSRHGSADGFVWPYVR